jgi:hypothetical protein
MDAQKAPERISCFVSFRLCSNFVKWKLPEN